MHHTGDYLPSSSIVNQQHIKHKLIITQPTTQPNPAHLNTHQSPLSTTNHITSSVYPTRPYRTTFVTPFTHHLCNYLTPYLTYPLSYHTSTPTPPSHPHPTTSGIAIRPSFITPCSHHSSNHLTTYPITLPLLLLHHPTTTGLAV